MATPQNGEEIHVDEIEASAGEKAGVGRYVLIFGTLIGIILLGGVALIGGLSQGDVEEEVTVSGRIQSTEGGSESNDGVLGVEPERTQDTAEAAGPDVGAGQSDASAPDTGTPNISNTDAR